MRAPLLLALALLLPGCALPRPADAMAHHVELREGPWTMVVSWDSLAGAPGDEVRFRVRVDAAGDPAPYQTLAPGVAYVRLGDGRALVVEGRSATIDGSAIVGPVERLVFRLVAHDGTGRDATTFTFEGPEVTLRDGVRASPVPSAFQDDVAEVPPGLSAQRRDGSVVATFASDDVVQDSCHRSVAQDSEWFLVEGDGPPRLVGFVARMSTDACVPEPPTRPRVVATLAQAPEPLDVVAVGFESCFCPALPWFREAVTA